LNHLILSSKETFLSVSNSSHPFIFKGINLLFDERNHYFQEGNNGEIFINGEREGLEFGWLENGSKWRESSWKDGERDGIETG
jgi:antitoxin component YwqK of YwqJK toxin-antitoxin module